MTSWAMRRPVLRIGLLELDAHVDVVSAGREGERLELGVLRPVLASASKKRGTSLFFVSETYQGTAVPGRVATPKRVRLVAHAGHHGVEVSAAKRLVAALYRLDILGSTCRLPPEIKEYGDALGDIGKIAHTRWW